MRKKERGLSLVLAVLMVLLLCPVHTFAIDQIELDREVTLTVSYCFEKEPMVGVRFNLYHIADTDKFAEFTLREEFKDYPVRVENNDVESWSRLAQTFKGYVLEDGVKPTASGETDEDGLLYFEGLEMGLYLIVGELCELEDGFYYPTPAIICLPNRNAESETWDYDVIANIKCEYEEKTGGKDMRRVLKEWQDGWAKEKRPTTIVVTLLCDGEVYDTQVLSEETGWSYVWKDLEEGHDWTISEQVPKQYWVRVTQDSKTFIVINQAFKEPTEPPKPPLPQTGVLWWPVPVLLSAGLLSLIIGIVRRRGSRNA